MNDLMSVLEKLTVLNRDNSYLFTNTERLDAIASLLCASPYKKTEAHGLYHLYSRKPVSEIDVPVIIVSTHVDCERHITKCFTTRKENGNLLGTFDNAITNAAIVYLMLLGNLPENVLVAFTGDEEESGRGAKDICRFIQKNDLDVLNVFVLDVTEEGWKTEADFTVENDFWDDDVGKKVVELANQTGYSWNYVPGDPDDIPEYIPKEGIIDVEAYEDESWEYDEADLSCFSLCLPSNGDMHSNAGILVRESSFRRYTEVLEKMLNIQG